MSLYSPLISILVEIPCLYVRFCWAYVHHSWLDFNLAEIAFGLNETRYLQVINKHMFATRLPRQLPSGCELSCQTTNLRDALYWSEFPLWRYQFERLN
jgi:hypothetical protein